MDPDVRTLYQHEATKSSRGVGPRTRPSRDWIWSANVDYAMWSYEAAKTVAALMLPKKSVAHSLV